MENQAHPVHQLNQMISQGEIIEAFDLFYDDDVVMQENEENPIVGKAANRKREQDFFGAIIDFRGMRPKNVAIANDIAMTEWELDYTHKEWGDKKYSQVAVQQWQSGRVVFERFYYAN